MLKNIFKSKEKLKEERIEYSYKYLKEFIPNPFEMEESVNYILELAKNYNIKIYSNYSKNEKDSLISVFMHNGTNLEIQYNNCFYEFPLTLNNNKQIIKSYIKVNSNTNKILNNKIPQEVQKLYNSIMFAKLKLFKYYIEVQKEYKLLTNDWWDGRFQ